MSMKRYSVSRICSIFLVFTCVLSLTGCFVVAATGIAASAYVAADRRNSETMFLDQGLELRIKTLIARIPDGEDAHVTVSSYNAIVLITGEIPSERVRREVTKIAMGMDHVRRVINRTVVGKNASIACRLQDARITAELHAKLLSEHTISPNLVKISTERQVIYLMGLLTTEEASRVIAVAQQVGAVKKIVNVFEYVRTVGTGDK